MAHEVKTSVKPGRAAALMLDAADAAGGELTIPAWVLAVRAKTDARIGRTDAARIARELVARGEVVEVKRPGLGGGTRGLGRPRVFYRSAAVPAPEAPQ